MWQPHGTNALLEAQGVPVKTVRDVRRRVTEDLFHRAFSSRLLRLTLQGPLEGASWKEMQGGLKHHCSCFGNISYISVLLLINQLQLPGRRTMRM